MSATKDLTGQTFGLLVVIERAGSSPSRDALWRCACSCPARNETLAATRQLKCGDTKSCGCLRGRSRSNISRSSPRPPKSAQQTAPKTAVKDPARASACLTSTLMPTGAVRRSVERMLRQYGTGKY